MPLGDQHLTDYFKAVTVKELVLKDLLSPDRAEKILSWPPQAAQECLWAAGPPTEYYP